MRNLRLFLVLLAALLGLASCGKEPEPTGYARPDDKAVIAFDQDSAYTITTAYHMVADGEHEYAFICGPITAPGCVLKLESDHALSPEWYAFPHQVEGELVRYLPTGTRGNDVSEGKLRVAASEAGLHFYTVDARAGGQLFALGYDGPFIEVGHNGSGSLTYAGQTKPLDGACLTASRLGNYNVVLLLLTSATTSAEADLVFLGTSIGPGTYPIGDALTLLGGGTTGELNGQELNNGSVIIAQEGDTYTITGSGVTQSGGSFSLTYTGTIAVIQ